jgi:hypothetical protein
LRALVDISNHPTVLNQVSRVIAECLYDDCKAVRDCAVNVAESFANREFVKALMDSLSDCNSHKPAANDADNTTIWHTAFALDLLVDRLELTTNAMKSSEKLYAILPAVLSRSNPSDLDIWKIGDSLGDHIKGSRSLAILTQMLKHPDPKVRDSAVHGLGHLGGPESTRLSTSRAQRFRRASKGRSTIRTRDYRPRRQKLKLTRRFFRCSKTLNINPV